VRATYAVTWSEDGAHRSSGRLELTDRAVELTAAGASLEVPYDEIEAVAVARGRADRLDGRPTLVLQRVAGAPVRIASVVQSWILAELADRLAHHAV
jgi:hypothetical protein